MPGRNALFVDTARTIDREGRDTEVKGVAPPLKLTDENLVARAQEGDRRALDELVGRYQEKAYSIAYNMCSGGSEEAQELTQEAFLRAFRGLKNFRGKSSFYTWFYRILVNTCLDGRRRRVRWERIFSFWRPGETEGAPSREIYEEYPDMDEASNPMAALSGKELGQEVRKALQSLPERQSTAFQLKALHGMSIREIAQVTGVAEGTVKSRLFHAMRFLREALNEWTQP